MATFERIGDKYGSGLAFALFLPHPACGSVLALTFQVERSTDCTVYTKSGMVKESLAARHDWRSSWTGRLQPGANTVPLHLNLNSGQLLSIYIQCSIRAILYSTEKLCMISRAFNLGCDDSGRQLLSDEMKTDAPVEGPFLVCLPGQGSVSPNHFAWPPPDVLLERHRFFAGDIVLHKE